MKNYVSLWNGIYSNPFCIHESRMMYKKQCDKKIVIGFLCWSVAYWFHRCRQNILNDNRKWFYPWVKWCTRYTFSLPGISPAILMWIRWNDIRGIPVEQNARTGRRAYAKHSLDRIDFDCNFSDTADRLKQTCRTQWMWPKGKGEKYCCLCAFSIRTIERWIVVRKVEKIEMEGNIG